MTGAIIAPWRVDDDSACPDYVAICREKYREATNNCGSLSAPADIKPVVIIWPDGREELCKNLAVAASVSGVYRSTVDGHCKGELKTAKSGRPRFRYAS